jgi:DNA modification methylase
MRKKENILSRATAEEASERAARTADFIIQPSWSAFFQADARKRSALADNSIDLILTSPPYWQKRDYETKKQLGREKTARGYINSLVKIMNGWKPLLKESGSVFINIGDSYKNGCLLEIPSLLAAAATRDGWKLRERIVWEKPNSTPHAARRRLALREEYVLHFTLSDKYYSDLEGYKERFDGSVSNIWRIRASSHRGEHPAPFPEELVERILFLACPRFACAKCGRAFARQIEATAELDDARVQARRALEIFNQSDLTFEHIKAIQAVGISDAGKAIKFQNGAGKNSARARRLAEEAKQVLGGYFREFTFAKKRTVGWRGCSCKQMIRPGLVYDPFAGTRTTLRVAIRLGFSAIGSDLKIYDD